MRPSAAWCCVGAAVAWASDFLSRIALLLEDGQALAAGIEEDVAPHSPLPSSHCGAGMLPRGPRNGPPMHHDA